MHTVSSSKATQIIYRLVAQEYEPANLRVSVTGDQDGVYQDQVLKLSGGDGPMKPTLLLIGKRLGHDNVNPLYYSSLKVSSLKL
jgi:cysteine protease ATG4